MSSINNVITTTFRAVGGNVTSQLGSYAAGFGRLGQQIYGATNQSSRLNQQWKAFGTTIRYAIAGSTLYGLGNMVRQLSQVNQQLGQMQALSEIGPGTRFSDSNMNNLFVDLQNTAMDTITPLQDVNDAAVNFLSTVQGVKPSELPAMLTEIGRAAKLSQTNMEDLTQAATVAQVQFKRPTNVRTVGQFTSMWTQLIGEAPGAVTAAPSIAQALPGLAAVFTGAGGGGGVSKANMQAQLMSLTLGVLRTGMPPATAMRGLQYFIQSIAFAKKGTKNAAALAQIGVTPEFIDQHGIYAAVMKVLHNIKGVDPATMKQLAGLPEDSNALPGVSAAERNQLAQMIPRIHGQRAAIILASQLQRHGQVESLAGDLQTMLGAMGVNTKQTKENAKAWQDFEKRSRLAEATIAIQNMGTQVAMMFNPLFNFVAKAPIGLAHLMNRHSGFATIAGRTMVGLLAGGAIGRMFGVGNLPGIRRIPGMQRLLGGSNSMVPQGLAAMAALSGNPGILGATPQNPMYVSVINDLFGGGVRGGGPAPPGGGGGSGLPKVFGWFRGAGGFLKNLGVRGYAKLGAGAMGAAEMFQAEFPGIADTSMWMPGKMNPYYHRRNPGWENFLSLGLVNRETGTISPQAYPAVLAHANRVLAAREGRILGVESLKKGEFHGKVDFNLIVDQVDANGKSVRRTVHVPVDIWSGPNKHPSNRGQSGRNGRR